MAGDWRRLRKRATQRVLDSALRLSTALPVGPQRLATRGAVALAGYLPGLPARIRKNMELALGERVPPGAERRYFRHVGWLMASSLAVYHRSLGETPVVDEVKLGGTAKVLQDAHDEGRGVILTVPHWTGHELVAACIARRFPIVFLVRETADPRRAEQKRKWYAALGVETVIRPLHSSSLKEAVAYLKVLKSGRMLAITPDILSDGELGVDVSLFGRATRIHGGSFSLAAGAGSPMVRVSGVWQPDWSVNLTFERAPEAPPGGREAAIRFGAQSWCDWFEARLREQPENWLFWLDKRWSALLRTRPREALD